MQDKLNLKDNNYHILYNERFNKYLDNIKHNNNCKRETQKRARENLKSTSGANANLYAITRRIPKNSIKEFKKTSQGYIRRFSL